MKDSALLQSGAVGCTNLVFTMAALAIIDHFGRKRLMIVGSIGYILSLGAVAWAFYSYDADFATAAKARAADKAAVAATAMFNAVDRGNSEELAASKTAANEAVRAATEAEATATAGYVVEAIKAVQAGNTSKAEAAASNALKAR